MKDAVAVKPKRLGFISFLRVFSMLCILLCHYVQQYPNPVIKSTSQFFNVGVQLFFIISGFCFGLQGEISSPGKWYAKRLKRIYIPYELFLLIYFVIFLILSKKIYWRDWGMYVLGLQGTYFRIPGIEQTWFITSLLACYAVTPLISVIYKKLNEKSLRIKILIGAAAFAVYTGICFVPNDYFYSAASPIVFFAAAYFYGRDYKYNPPKRKTAVLSFFAVIAAFAAMLASHMMFGGTLLHTGFVSGTTHYIAAIGIFKVFEYVFRNARENKIINYIDSISFEVYLCHYLFLNGALYFFMLFTPSITLNLVIATAATLTYALIVHSISSLILKKIK